jgi:hypothetical protein
MTDTLVFDEYVDVLRKRLYEYEALDGGAPAPDVHELMADYDEVAPSLWPVQAWERLDTQGHLDIGASGKAYGPRPGGIAFGLLSANGVSYVRQQRKAA